jgi:hypothetical protein
MKALFLKIACDSAAEHITDLKMDMTNSNNSREPSILFACAGNTCRSVMAEHLAGKLFGDSVIFESAGIRPQSPTNASNALFIGSPFYQALAGTPRLAA